MAVQPAAGRPPLAGTPLRRLMLMLDVWLDHGKREAPGTWWNLVRSK